MCFLLFCQDHQNHVILSLLVKNFEELYLQSINLELRTSKKTQQTCCQKTIEDYAKICKIFFFFSSWQAARDIACLKDGTSLYESGRAVKHLLIRDRTWIIWKFKRLVDRHGSSSFGYSSLHFRTSCGAKQSRLHDQVSWTFKNTFQNKLNWNW